MSITIDDLQGVLLEREATERYNQVYPDAQIRAIRYESFHKLYAPPGGDQWSEDLEERPEKLHISANIIRRFVDTEARLLSILPRVTIVPDMTDDVTRQRGEATEKLFSRYLQVSGWSEWYYTLNQVKSLYGIGIAHPYWNDRTGMPDVTIVEQPQNLLIGWGDSDFTLMDWTIYNYRISQLQAKMKYPDFPDEYLLSKRATNTSGTSQGARDHSLPEPFDNAQKSSRNQPEYERNQVAVWDYWYLDADGKVMNCVMINGHLADGPYEHSEMPVIPYIPIESDHEPGSPDGHGTAELLIDIQNGLNRVLSQYAQGVWDHTDPAYQLNGPDAPMIVPPGLVPKSNQILAPGPGNQINLVPSALNGFPLDQLIARYWETAFRITGLNMILFGELPGAQTSGRALAMQLEGAINSLDPKRRRLYTGTEGLLNFWHHMTQRKNPKIDGVPASFVIKDMNRWKIIAPEITPRDVVEHTNNVVQMLTSKLQSLETSMDQLGIDNPIEEIERIKNERRDIYLFPADAQGSATVLGLLRQLGMEAGGNMTPEQQAGAVNNQQAAAQGQLPTGMEDQNQPPTREGSPPPAGGSAIGAELQPLERFTPSGNAQALSQVVLPRTQF